MADPPGSILRQLRKKRRRLRYLRQQMDGDVTIDVSSEDDVELQINSKTANLAESSLWKENIHENGHRSVWGSWYDTKSGRWGYSCCRSCEKMVFCINFEPDAPVGRGTFDDDSDSDSEARRIEEWRKVDWSSPPTELLPREEVEEDGGRPGAFIEHFVRFTVGIWRRLLDGTTEGSNPSSASDYNIPSEADFEPFKSREALQQAEDDLAPLLVQLQKKEGAPTIIQNLDKMVSLAARREYSEANAAYMVMVLGNKKWNNTLASYGGAAGQNKGARIYITKQDDLLEYDKDPVTRKYIHCVRRLVHLVQCIRPNADQAKRF
eukprot:TRINITY_DN56723_c0_g1_i1.p1 TRINITY_DN56723_c0_g1~~TRINITY_DN56723_c0_g1_i1.p1  ORF type:complete len:321 (-),score=69.98 TRINITY_DN56723_c0_g1_i1:47-1009(-)